jgi:hypothetical protein
VASVLSDFCNRSELICGVCAKEEPRHASTSAGSRRKYFIQDRGGKNGNMQKKVLRREGLGVLF